MGYCCVYMDSLKAFFISGNSPNTYAAATL
jgi:hypothetical protein